MSELRPPSLGPSSLKQSPLRYARIRRHNIQPYLLSGRWQSHRRTRRRSPSHLQTKSGGSQTTNLCELTPRTLCNRSARYLGTLSRNETKLNLTARHLQEHGQVVVKTFPRNHQQELQTAIQQLQLSLSSTRKKQEDLNLRWFRTTLHSGECPAPNRH